ncbi:MAG: hypothetical protein CME65_12920 [Halobacteriovoraceae bacterium]|nr:hypothetical protein [Halobacteriovoraceae bacterium]
MLRLNYRFTHIAAYLTILHGVIYGIYKYFFQLETEYGIRPHPSQEIWQSVHILLSPLLIFAFGLLWQNHIVRMYENAIIKRKTGITLVIFMLLMIFSGYLVQVVYAVDLQKYSAYLHIAVSAVFVLAYLIHHLQGRRR